MGLTSLHDFYLFSVRSLDLFVASLVFMKGTSCCVIRRNSKWNWALDLVMVKLYRSTWFPLLSACRFVVFDTSVVCHMFMHCFGSFLLQAMFLSLQVFVIKGQNMKLTVMLLFTCILRFDAGPAVLRTVCKYSSRFLSWMSYLSWYIFLQRPRSYTLR